MIVVHAVSALKYGVQNGIIALNLREGLSDVK